MLSLVIRSGPHRGRVFRLGERNLTIGRDERNLVQIVDPAVSRRHAALMWAHGDYVLSDLHSQNGTRLNGRPHERGAITAGDRIEIGGTVLEVVPDLGSGRDATRAPRVTDTSVVASKTLAGVKPSEGAEGWVDVARLVDQRQLAAIRLAATVRARLARGDDLEEVFPEAALGIERAIGPDRVIFYRVDAHGEPQVAAIHRRVGLGSDERNEAPHIRTLRRASLRGRPLIENSLGVGPSQTMGLASAIAVPLRGDGDRVIGVLYADSLAPEAQHFLAEDEDLLTMIGAALATGLPG